MYNSNSALRHNAVVEYSCGSSRALFLLVAKTRRDAVCVVRCNVSFSNQKLIWRGSVSPVMKQFEP